MSGKGLWFKRVDVKRMPGCCGFSLKNLASGVNVIHGPNASGKSTTARAIRSLLWPELAPSGSEINATFEYACSALVGHPNGLCGATRTGHKAADYA